MENLWIIYGYPYYQLIGFFREKIQENTMIFMGKSGWFPVIFPLSQPIDMKSMLHDAAIFTYMTGPFLGCRSRSIFHGAYGKSWFINPMEISSLFIL